MSTQNLNNSPNALTRASSLIILVVVAVAGVACAGKPANDPQAALVAAPAQDDPAPAQPAASATIGQTLPTLDLESRQPVAPTPVEVAALPIAVPGLPSAPAPPDQFRADPAHLVGATGRPQLVEIFAYW